MYPANIPEFYLPAEVAKILRCSEWWVKEQARRGRIPFCWIGGGYRFLPEHLAEIAQLFERRAAGSPPTPSVRSTHRKTGRTTSRRSGIPTQPATLTARVPPRARRALSQSAEAA
ncbi:helix-turn-helix domain-containing protein [Micromonospora sp. WMMA1363]|uniref:helix-turn-helix domain-containing protein n=1 Tax=Micromonospora sp. WMMA1363 TaxID=3053985 RepID=UPI0005B32B25|nr:helix-turn-helix domain-containing protein [Micromonospora sp. WMMA1363]MDM4721325.1 helix-turn-helix domain-containing protein [Micromonospora sp. WMMA1363]